jgi:hypothetical protein
VFSGVVRLPLPRKLTGPAIKTFSYVNFGWLQEDCFPGVIAPFAGFISTAKVATGAFPNVLCSALPHPQIGFSVSPSREDLITTIAVPQFGFEQHHFSPMCMSTSSGSANSHRRRILGQQTCSLVVFSETAWHTKQQPAESFVSHTESMNRTPS